MLIASILFLAAVGYGNPTWIRTYNYGPISYTAPIDGGHTVFMSALGPDAHLVRVDDEGEPVWELQFTGIPFGLAELPSSELILMYRSSGTLTLSGVDFEGNMLWTDEAPLETSFKGLVSTSDGCCVYLTGDSLVKLNPDGSLKWTAYIADVVEDAELVNEAAGVYGGVAIAGEDGELYSDQGMFQAAIADSAGTVLWSGTDYHMYCEHCEIYDVFGSSSEGCYGVGLFGSNFPPPMSNDALLSFLPGGDTDWTKKIDDARRVCESSDGNPVIAGHSDLIGTRDIIIRKIDNDSGYYIWQRSHGFPDGDETCSCISLCEDGGFVIGGFASPHSLLLRVDSQGLINGTGLEEEFTGASLQIVPLANPCSGREVVLQVRAPVSKLLEVMVFDASGRIVFSESLDSATGTDMVEVGNLPTGMYSALFCSEEFGSASCRVVVLDWNK